MIKENKTVYIPHLYDCTVEELSCIVTTYENLEKKAYGRMLGMKGDGIIPVKFFTTYEEAMGVVVDNIKSSIKSRRSEIVELKSRLRQLDPMRSLPATTALKLIEENFSEVIEDIKEYVAPDGVKFFEKIETFKDFKDIIDELNEGDKNEVLGYFITETILFWDKYPGISFGNHLIIDGHHFRHIADDLYGFEIFYPEM